MVISSTHIQMKIPTFLNDVLLDEPQKKENN